MFCRAYFLRFITAVVGLALLAGCAMLDSSNAPSAASGGGKAAPAQSDDSGGGRAAPGQSDDSGGGRTVPAQAAEAGGGAQAAPGTAQSAPGMPTTPVARGWSLKQGAVVFTVDTLEITPDSTKVGYSVDGLPASWQMTDKLPESWVELPNGEKLGYPAGSKGGGGGGGGSEGGLQSISSYNVYAALPPNTSHIVLVVHHNFFGKEETWRIPLKVK